MVCASPRTADTALGYSMLYVHVFTGEGEREYILCMMIRASPRTADTALGFGYLCTIRMVARRGRTHTCCLLMLLLLLMMVLMYHGAAARLASALRRAAASLLRRFFAAAVSAWRAARHLPARLPAACSETSRLWRRGPGLPGRRCSTWNGTDISVYVNIVLFVLM